MIRYSLVQFFKMVHFPHKADPVQTLREEDGFELTRAEGDCAIRIAYARDKWVDEVPLSNVARSRIIVGEPPVTESTRPFAKAAEILNEKGKRR